MVASLVVEVISEERRFTLILPFVSTAEVWLKEAMKCGVVLGRGEGEMNKDKGFGRM